MENHSGKLWIIGLVGAVAVYALLRRVLPSLADLLLAAGGIIAALLALLVGVVVYFAFRKPKGKAGESKAADPGVVLSKGRSNLMELRRMGLRVKNREIQGVNEEICGEIEKILRTLKEQPEEIPGVRKFFNYYLPTLGTILRKYIRLEESGVPAEEITRSTVSCLKDIRTAMEKQYTALFDDDILDLTAEMEALKMACRRDGLLTEEEFKLQEGGQSLTLTL